MIPSVHSGLFRAASVSSIRRTKVPPCCRAVAQLYRADRAPPTWNMPVGLGAKRTRMWTSGDVMGVRIPGKSSLHPDLSALLLRLLGLRDQISRGRSEEHTSELQSHS